MGIGIGAKNATVPIYSAEMAPARIRGALVMFWQLWVVIGIFLGFCANVIVKDTGRISWRLQLGSAFIPSFILMIGIFFCPESPRWLMKHGKVAKGFKSMDALRDHPIIAARDYYYSYVIYQEELKIARGAGYFQRLWDCFSVPRIRRANYGASTVMLAQQMCGINIISFYSSTIFVNAGYSPTQALYASLGYGAVQVVFTIPTLFLIDTKGRRTLCLITFPIMCVMLLAAGLSLLVPSDASTGAKIGPVVLFVYLFTIAYSMGEGPVAFQYSAEVFPTIQREQGMAWAVCINNTFAGILGLTFPRMTTVMTPTGACKSYSLLIKFTKANAYFSRFLRRSQPHCLGHDLLLRSRNKATHSRRAGPSLQRPHLRLPQVRDQGLAAVLLQAPHYAQADSQAGAAGHREQ
jgi:sugar porter (SP) family MFS transporter